MRLFGVVADDLVCYFPLLEPRAVTLVEIGAALFGDSRVRHVTDQDVVKAKRVLTPLAAESLDQAAPLDAREPAVQARKLIRWGEVHEGAACEVPPDDGRSLDEPALACVERIEPTRE
jgi:hypothetical protein